MEAMDPAGGAPAIADPPAKPSGLAWVALAFGLGSWVVGWCASIPGIPLAIAELIRIRRGRAPRAGAVLAWIGLASSGTHFVISTVLVVLFGGAILLWFQSCGVSSMIEPCDERAVCREEGQCGTSYVLTGDGINRCYVRGDEDCAASAACWRDRRCTYDARVSLQCIAAGSVPRPAAVVSVCESSPDCARWGRCALIEGACLADREEDCRRSLDCIVSGRCTLQEHVCVAGSDADCAGSLECRAFARCARQTHPLLGAIGTCTAPGEIPPASCSYGGAGADHCAETGECLINRQGTCETAEQHGIASPELDDVRRRLREAIPVDRPVSPR